jgi:hypothetical protein
MDNKEEDLSTSVNPMNTPEADMEALSKNLQCHALRDSLGIK